MGEFKYVKGITSMQCAKFANQSSPEAGVRRVSVTRDSSNNSSIRSFFIHRIHRCMNWSPDLLIIPLRVRICRGETVIS